MKARLRFRRESAQPHGDAAGLLLRALTFAFVAAMIALAVHQSRRDDQSRWMVRQRAVVVDPLATELARCRTITPEQNASDDTCRRVWAESRRRFLRAVVPTPERRGE